MNESFFFKEQIDSQQQNIQRLSSFVAVVDSCTEENPSDEQNISQLESSLQNVGERYLTFIAYFLLFNFKLF